MAGVEEEAVNGTAKTLADVAKEWDNAADEWTSGETGTCVLEFNRRAEEVIRAKVGSLQDKDVLDFGAGHGSLGLALAPDCRSVHMVDISTKMISQVEANIAAMGATNAKATCCDILAGNDALALASFDLIMSGSVLTFAPDMPGTLAKLTELMRPDGLALHFVHRLQGDGGELRLRGRTTDLSYGDGMAAAQLKDELEAAGLVQIDSGELVLDFGGMSMPWLWALARKPPA